MKVTRRVCLIPLIPIPLELPWVLPRVAVSIPFELTSAIPDGSHSDAVRFDGAISIHNADGNLLVLVQLPGSIPRIDDLHDTANIIQPPYRVPRARNIHADLAFMASTRGADAPGRQHWCQAARGDSGRA
jgi:hypothetical protein